MSTEIPFHRRHLSHFYPPDAVYFITSRLADSLPPSAGEELARIIEYVMDNPVKAGLVENRREWKRSFSGFEL